MQNARLWERVLGVERTVVEQVVFDEEAGDGEGAIVASVRPRKGATRRCGVCGRRCPCEVCLTLCNRSGSRSDRIEGWSAVG